jgi:hypothetical protein
MIQANGGVIRDGMFILDPLVRGTIAANTKATPANPVPAFVPAEPRWCNPTPPFAPTLGGYTDPVTGNYCHPIAAQRWASDWQRINPDTVLVNRPVAGFGATPFPPTPMYPTTLPLQRSAQAPGFGATPSWVAPVVIVGIVVGVGYLIYKSMQQRAQVYRSVADREGSTGVLKLEAGEAALGLVEAGTAALLDRRSRRNPPRRKRRR